MRYRPLGRTGIQISVLGFGAMMFGWRIPARKAATLVAAAAERGVNLFDTSDSYGNGASEEVLGAAIAQAGIRDRVLVATKAHYPTGQSDPNARGNNRRHLIAACEASLRRLGLDHIDLYQIHHPEPAVPIDETLRALDDLVRAGKVRYIGTSSFAAWQLVESLWAAKEHHLNRFVAEQPPYNLLERRAEWELFPMAQTYGFGLLVWSPLAEGILSGKYRAGAPFPKDSRFAAITEPGRTKSSGYGQRLNPAVERLLNVMRELAAAKDCSMSQLALAWAIRPAAVSAALIGPTGPRQLEDNLGALNVEITDADAARLDAAAPPGGALSPYYDSDFGPHTQRW
ncbi:MAG: aldo/keto reductase [Alphaproteobacteria bacterium]